MTTTLPTVGVMSPGDMGSGIGWALAQGGADVIVALDDRSPRTKTLAAESGLRDVGSLEAMVRQADIVMSVLVPSEALAAAERVAAALRATGSTLTYVDCNAISPDTTRAVGRVIEAAGSTFVDASIIGAPPRKPGTRFYASGPEVARFETLRAHGLDVRPLSDRIGDASAIKMCYAAMTKGLSALASELLIASHRLGVQDALQAELESSQKGLVGWVGNSLRSTPSKAHRWVGEMEEIAATFAAVGLTPKILDGAADMFRYIATTDLGHEAPEEVDMTRDLWTIAAELSREPAGLRG